MLPTSGLSLIAAPDGGSELYSTHMPAPAAPLFRPDVLRRHLAGFIPPASAQAFRASLTRWAELLGSARGNAYKESELLADFLTHVFVEGLGYTPPVAQTSDARYTFTREALVQADNKFADAVLGDFTPAGDRPVVAVEGKGPRDPLDRPFAGRKMSAVDQGYRYAINLPCDWIVITNLREVRLYHKGATQRTYERFVVADMAADERELARFVYILGAERVVPRSGKSHLYELLAQSQAAGEALTQRFYREYAAIRRDVFAMLRDDNPRVAAELVLGATQKLLDRVLFIAFAEDRGLLPADTLSRAYQHHDPYNPRPVWENFRGLFRAIDLGSEQLGIAPYNGGLFAIDYALDGLAVSDAACGRLKRLGEYDYHTPEAADALPPIADATEGDDAALVDVEILGHIFEQSITDLEALRGTLDGSGAAQGASRRRREGAFYTPAFVTRFLVAEALSPALDERFERLRTSHAARATGTAPAVLANPQAYALDALNRPQRQALVDFWEAWLGELPNVRVIDPACGSGAFLIEAFDQLHVAYERAVEHLEDLRGSRSLFDPDRTILRNNLYGVDLNEEAVDICRLSIWIKTAQRGKALTDLDHNIRAGNSVVADPETDPKAFDWHAAFPEVFAAGGFDAVVGNPPYVRADHLLAFKQHFAEHYRAFHGSADLYVYFVEQGFRVLRPGGRLSFVVTNKWLKAEYAEPLRRYLSDSAWVEQLVDLGHARQVFPEADVFPSIVLFRAPAANEAPPAPRAAVIPRSDLQLDRLAEQVRDYSFVVEREALTPEQWLLEPPSVRELMARIGESGVPLAEYIGAEPLRGIMTGYNDAFLLASAEREALVASDPSTTELFEPYVRGQDMGRWLVEWDGRWLLALRSSSDHPWPWSDAGDGAEAVFARTFPALHRHMKSHEERLRRRTDQGRYWWELRSCSYYELFKSPKVFYQEIQYYPAYAFDTRGLYTNNKGFFLPTDDLYLLGVLNSPLMWWHNWRFLPHMKDDALTPAGVRLRQLPIAQPSDAIRERVTLAVREVLERTAQRQDQLRQLHEWLRVEFGVEAVGQKLSAPELLDSDAFIAEVKKRRTGRRGVTAAELRRLREEFDASVAPLRDLGSTTGAREHEISDAIMEAYALQPEDVELVWATAPPRMPLASVRDDE